MKTFRRGARSASVILAAAVIAGGLAASPALAGLPHAAALAQTWTVKPGGSIKGKSGQVLLEDTATGSTIKCVSSTAVGKLKSGSGLSGTAIGSLTSATYIKCVGPLGLSYTITASASPASRWRLNAKSYDAQSGVTTGTITDIEATLRGSGCKAAVAGITATVPGTVKITYANRTRELRFHSGGGGTLHFWHVSGCAGLFGSGNPAQVDVCYVITPPQTVTETPQPGKGPDLTGTGPTGTGPPC
jgi:hypothetical protein